MCVMVGGVGNPGRVPTAATNMRPPSLPSPPTHTPSCKSIKGMKYNESVGGGRGG